MGRKAKSGKAEARDDDALLDAAIAENKKLSEAAAKEEAAPAVGAAAAGPSKRAPAALGMEVLIKKLNAAPTFCILNGQREIVGLKDPTDPTGQLEVCVWFIDPQEAKETLAAVKEANPELRAELHLGVTPLGVSYAFAAGLAESTFFGSKVLRGSREPFANGQDPTALLREQAISQGLTPPSWHVPVFCCDELQSESVLPVFLSRKALAEAWVTSGRKIAALPQNLTVMDLGVLVCQMQTDATDWTTLHFVHERKAVNLVHESKAAAAAAAPPPPPASDDPTKSFAPAAGARAPSLSAPPPLPTDDDDAPPPLEPPPEEDPDASPPPLE